MLARACAREADAARACNRGNRPATAVPVRPFGVATQARGQRVSKRDAGQRNGIGRRIVTAEGQAG